MSDNTAEVLHTAIIGFDVRDNPAYKRAVDGLNIDGITLPDDPHITMYWLGDVDKLDKADLLDKLNQLAQTIAPIRGRISGLSLFSDSGDGYPLVMIVDSPQLPFVRAWLGARIGMNQTHGLVPHITLSYVKDVSNIDKWDDVPDQEIVIDHIAMFWGGELIRIPLTGGYIETKERRAMIRIIKGGPGSGNYGHAGRPGSVGGSAPKSGIGAAMSIRSGKTANERQQYVRIMGLEGRRVSMSGGRRVGTVTGGDGYSARVEWDDGRVSHELIGPGQRITIRPKPKTAKPVATERIPELSQSERNDLTERWGYSDTTGHKYTNERLTKLAGHKTDVVDFVHHTFDYTDENSGLTTVVERLNTNYNALSVEGGVYDKNGMRVGRFERTLYYDNAEVHHDYMRIGESDRGSGFGSKYYQHLEDSYAKVGIKQVTIYANIDVGGYAWGRMGFDWAAGESGEWPKNKVIREYRARYGHAAMTPELQSSIMRAHPYELAALTGPDGFKIGKEGMLGTSWNAIKFLSPDHPTWQVGRAYYESKKKGKK